MVYGITECLSSNILPLYVYAFTCTTDLVNLLISRVRLYVELCARHRHPFIIIIWLLNSWKMFLQRLSVWSRQMIITLNHRFLSFLVNMAIVYGSNQGCYIIIFLCETWPFVCWIIGYTRYADRRCFFFDISYMYSGFHLYCLDHNIVQTNVVRYNPPDIVLYYYYTFHARL